VNIPDSEWSSWDHVFELSNDSVFKHISLVLVPSNSPLQRNELTRAIALYLIGWIVLCWPWLSGQFTVPWDAKAHFYPQFAFLARVLQNGNIPYWNPYILRVHHRFQIRNP